MIGLTLNYICEGAPDAQARNGAFVDSVDC